MISEKEVNELFKKFVKTTNNDNFKIEFEDGEANYKLNLNYIIQDKSAIRDSYDPVLHISKYKDFIKKLTVLINKEYEFYKEDKEFMGLTEEGYKDYIMLSTFVNMQEADFNSPMSYFDRLIKAYDEKYVFNKKEKVGEIAVGNKKIEIIHSDRRNSATMESPVSKKIILKDGDKEFALPRVHYYISDNKIYIMGIQNFNKSNDEFCKKMDRYLRRFNKGLEDIEISEDGKVDTIRDISVRALASLTLFISLFEKYGEFYMPDYLPLRYNNKYKVCKDNKDYEEIDKIQKNLTDRFLMTGVRFCEHFPNFDYNFYNGLLQIQIGNGNVSDKERTLVHEFFDSVNESAKKEPIVLMKKTIRR